LYIVTYIFIEFYNFIVITLAALKSEFHNLIDKIEDPGILEQYYKALSTSIKPDNSLWASLTSEQQKVFCLHMKKAKTKQI